MRKYLLLFVIFLFLVSSTIAWAGKSAEILKRAELGEPKAQFIVGLIYHNNQKEYESAAYWFTKAAEQGYALAQDYLGRMYGEGLGVPQDYAKAFAWLTLAAEQGLVGAQLTIAMMNDEGKGVEVNHEDAVYWYTRAAEEGDPNAQFNLGVKFAKGQGTTRDIQQAVFWLTKAAEQGHSDAQMNLGSLYYNGELVEQNYNKSFHWNKKAAIQGNPLAQYNLGLAYFNGRGVLQNDKFAFAWFNLSASQGYKPAVEAKDSMAKEILSYSQVSQAQDISIELKKQIDQYIQSQKSANTKSKTDKEISGSGTGFFITKSGYILTCHHVINNANDIRIVFNGKEYPAKLIRTDPNNDLALLKIEGSYPAIAFSANRSAKMGEKVFTVGYPNPSIQGVNLKYNSGTVSSLTGFQDDVRLYQISVPVQPGNSGGPLLDENGHILGVIVSQLDAKTAFAVTGTLPQNVNYAIKSIYAQAMLEHVPELSDKLVNPVKNNSNVIDKAKHSTVMVLCYTP